MAPLLGGLLQPETVASIFLIPATAGIGFIAGAARIGAATAAFEGAAELGRRRYDPLATTEDSLVRVGAATLFAGLVGGGAGYLGSVAASRATRELSGELAAVGGISKFTDKIAFGGEVALVKRMGAARFSVLAKGSRAERDGVQFVPDRKVVNIDYGAMMDQFSNSAWRKMGITASEGATLFPNVNAWAEFRIRLAVAEAVPGAGRADAMGEALTNFKAWRLDNRAALKSRAAKLVGRLIDTPYKRIVRSATTRETIDLVDVLAGDGGLASTAHGGGRTVGASVDMLSKELVLGRPAVVKQAEDDLFLRYINAPNNPRVGDISLRKAVASGASITEFREKAVWAFLSKEPSGNQAVDEYANVLGRFFKEFERDARRTGVIGGASDGAAITARISALEERVADLTARAAKASDPKLIDSYAADLDIVRGALDEARIAQANPLSAAAESNYFTRIWSRANMLKHPKTAKAIIRRAVLSDPEIKLWKTLPDGSRKLEAVKASSDPADVAARVDEIYNAITEGDPISEIFEAAATGSTFSKMRVLASIDNKALMRVQMHPDEGSGLVNLIETDPLLVTQTYAQRMGPVIAFADRFNTGAGSVSGFNDAVNSALAAEARNFKGSPKQLAAHLADAKRDLEFMKDRVLRRVVTEPDRLDNRAASFLKDMTHLALLGGAGLSTIADAGKIVVANGVGAVARKSFLLLDDTLGAYNLGVQEAKKAGGASDVSMNLVSARVAEAGMDPIYMSGAERALRGGVNKFFLFNGLAVMSYAMRGFEGAVRADRILGDALALAKNGATGQQVEFLAQYGINKATARKIAAEFDGGRIQKTADGMFLANTDAWENASARRAFRAALSTGIDNTILVASAADKPAIFDGVLHFRKNAVLDRLAGRYGWKDVGEHWRVHSGIIGLPFVYWSFATAATNKILASAIERPSSRVMGGLAVMMGLGYMSGQIKDSFSGSGAWGKMTPAEKMVRVVDQSGVMGVVPDLTFLMQGALIAGAGVNPLPVGPRYGIEPTPGSVALDFLGAPASVAGSLIGGGIGLATGREGAGREFIRGLPGQNHPLFRQVYDYAREAGDAPPSRAVGR